MIIMSAENNEKYIAKSWIDDGVEEGFKKSFLESLLNQWQGEGNGFDADKLDGKHYCQIINDIDEKIDGLIPSFQIGNVHFNRDNINSNSGILRVGFDGVQLNVPGEDGYEDYQRLPWDEEGETRSGEPNLLKAFEELYEIVDSKLDGSYQSSIDTLISFKNNLDDSISYDSTGKVLINAQTINGIRIYLKTPSQYQELKEAAAEDENSDEAKLINDPHNLFIINDGSSIPEDIHAMQPGTQPISSYYQFRKIKKEVEGENGSIKEEYWLQYKHSNEYDDQWHDICKTEEFIDYETLVTTFIEFMENNANYTINSDSLNRSLNNTNFNDDNSSNLTDYIRWSGIRGLTQSKYNDVELESTPAIDNDNLYGSPRYVNLDNLLTKIESIIDQKIEENWQRIYPVGAIFISYDDINPNTAFGGTWERIEGRFLVGNGSANDKNNKTRQFQAFGNNRFGGEYYHYIETPELPTHDHTIDAHAHNCKEGYWFLTTKTTSGGDADWWQSDNKHSFTSVSNNSNGRYWVITNSQAYVAQWRATDYSGPTLTGKTGQNIPMSILPTYCVVHIWRRTA